MAFHLCQSKPPYEPHILLKNTEIPYISEVKILGIYITENQSWQAHICSMCHRLSKTYYLISRTIRRTPPPEKCDLKSACVLYAEGKYLFPNL